MFWRHDQEFWSDNYAAIRNIELRFARVTLCARYNLVAWGGLLVYAARRGEYGRDIGPRVDAVGALILVWARCPEVVVAPGGVHKPDRVQVGREEVADRVARGRPPDHRIPGKDVPRHVEIEGGLLARVVGMNAVLAVIHDVVGELELLRHATDNGDQGIVGEARLVVELDGGQLAGVAGDLEQAAVPAPAGADILPEIVVEAHALHGERGEGPLVGQLETGARMPDDVLPDPDIRGLGPRGRASLVGRPHHHREARLRVGPGVLEDVPLNQHAPPELQLEQVFHAPRAAGPPGERLEEVVAADLDVRRDEVGDRGISAPEHHVLA